MYSVDDRQSPYLLCTQTEESLRKKMGGRMGGEGVYVCSHFNDSQREWSPLLILISVTGWLRIQNIVFCVLLFEK
jgi:hypothetical protein